MRSSNRLFGFTIYPEDSHVLFYVDLFGSCYLNQLLLEIFGVDSELYLQALFIITIILGQKLQHKGKKNSVNMHYEGDQDV